MIFVGRCAGFGIALALAAGCGRSVARPSVGDLQRGRAAEVGTVAVPIELVSRVVDRASPSPAAFGPKEAVRRLVEDALSEDEARARALRDAGSVTWQADTLLARRAAERLRAEAERLGPATEGELSDVSVVHALVMRSSGLGEGAAVLAKSIAAAVATARDEPEFIARAGAVPHGLARVVVERVPPFDAGGNIAGGGHIDPTFVAAAFSLRAPGDTTVVETRFGWHVVRLLEKSLPAPGVLATRRSGLGADVLELRVRQALMAVLQVRRLRTAVDLAPDCDSRMTAAFARLH